MSQAQLEDGFGMESISLGGYYAIVALTTTIGIFVVIILNLSTPLYLFPGKVVRMALRDTASYGTSVYEIFIQMSDFGFYFLRSSLPQPT